MKKKVGLILIILLLLGWGRTSLAQGPKTKGKLINPAITCYRALNRASQSLSIAQGLADEIKGGNILINKAELCYQKALQLYKEKKYQRSLEYARASCSLSRAVVHLYRAKTLKPIPPPLSPPQN